MKLIKPSVEYIPQSVDADGLFKHIESCARICYKSEDRITEDSAKKLVESLISSKHWGMVEHGTIYAVLHSSDRPYIHYPDVLDSMTYDTGDFWLVANSPYSKLVYDKDTECNYVTTNMRVLLDLSEREDDFSYDNFLLSTCPPTEHHVKRYTMKFTCARIDSQSITRYRTNSYAQESQRVINYLQEIRGASVTFSEPIWVKPEDLEELKQDAAISEQLYFKWIKKGYKPEEARYFLINGTKTEIIVTAFEDDWRYFLDQRLRNTTGKPSSDMHHLAQLLWNEFKDKLNLEL